MSTPNPVLVAAAPELIAMLKAIAAFNINIGVDPTKWALTVPGALTVLLGTIQLQIPALVAGEAGALQASLNSNVAKWITSLETQAGLPTA